MQKQKGNKRRFGRPVLMVAAVILIIVAVISYKLYSTSGFGISYTNPPKFIQHDFTDLAHITSISKFRSSAGHDFSAGGETCRSMKHYFAPNASTSDASEADSKDVSKKLSALQPDGKTDVPIYSPVDGTIERIESEHTELGKQVWIVPDSAKGYVIRLFHVTPEANLSGTKLLFLSGTHVSAGQKIGVISAKQDVDIAIQTGVTGINQHFISYFDVMPDALFATYQARGLASRSDAIIAKTVRDASPLSCKHDSEESFNYPANYDDSSDYVRLSGYVALQSSNNTGASASSPSSAKGNNASDDVCRTAVGKPPGCP